MSATEVARNFSYVLDLVAAGETVEITRGKAVLGVLTPRSPDSWGELVAQLSEFKAQVAPYKASEKKRIQALDLEVADYRYSEMGFANDREVL